MRSLRQEDDGRRFVITYHLADDTMTIFEPLPPNSGRMTARFLVKSKVPKPMPKVNGEPDYFTIGKYLRKFIDVTNLVKHKGTSY